MPFLFTTKAATFLTKICNSITHQWPVPREVFKPSTDSARHRVSTEKNSVLGLGSLEGASLVWGLVYFTRP